MFFDINKGLCDSFPGLDPIKILDYPADDVFELIGGLIDYNERNETEKGNKNGNSKTPKIIRRKAGDDWF